MSVIFELNDYVQPPPAPGSGSGQQHPLTNGAVLTQDAIDANAAKYHFTDVIAPPDTLRSPLQTPERIAMHHPSLSGFPTFVAAGTIDSVDPRSRRGGGGGNPSSSSNSAHNTVYQLQLLVRMKNYATDLCVRINVPMKEIALDEGEVEAEVVFARELLERVVATLEVRDFGLFGAAA
ncbi:hypothetical protein PV08_10506 [Exophiala spinifera]|uniref:Uncharacterized protein n=1 Tax=Exophiala spinifera TaxID=91928 RepID=A0A0D1Y896_9EURO|nr:uncharacterized protein PV08_10506 [Exophiala spinifera]KIW11206.1 hypothetical protein PV08_10506 [Exophiala spinifera]